jgi:hypothetical protein
MNKHIGNMANQAAAEGRTSSIVSSMNIAASSLAENTTFKRFLVEEVIFDPSELDDARLQEIKAKFSLVDAAFLKEMPPNTVIGRMLNESGTGHERHHYLFPFLPPHIMLPIHAGEHVWAFFENDKAIDHGFWLWRISEPRNVDDLNHTHADRKYHASERPKNTKDKFEESSDGVPGFENGPTFVKDGDVVTSAASASAGVSDPKIYEKLLEETDSAKASQMEAVPRLKKRPGDHVIQGSNNTAIILGTDRTGRTAKFKGSNSGKKAEGFPKTDQVGESGTIDVVVGRGQTNKTSGKKVENSLKKQEVVKKIEGENPEEGDPDFANDLGRFYLSMKTDPDGNMEINFSDRVDAGVPAGILKTDHLRVVVRKTMKMLVQPRPGASESECSGIVFKDGNVIFLPSANGLVLLGGEDADKAILTSGLPAVGGGGFVTAAPIVDTWGGQQGIGGPNGSWATKVKIK